MRNYHLVTINIYWFGIAFLWNGVHPIILPAVLLHIVPDHLKNTYLGGLTFAGLVLAMLVQPIAGAFSDRTVSRWGKRKPWILVGTACSLLFLVGMAAPGGFWSLAIAYLFLQVASNTAHAPAQGLIPDHVDPKQHGLASGIKNLFDMGGLIIISLIAGQLTASGSFSTALIVIGAVLGTSAALTILGTPTLPVINRDASPTTPPTATPATRNLDYFRLLMARFLILCGIYAVQGFAQYYIRDRLGVENPAAVTGNLMAAIGISITLLVVPAGILSDRLGRWRLNLFSGLLASFGIALLLLVNNLSTLYLVGAVIGSATGIFLSSNWSMATRLAPAEQAGRYLGLSNLATAGAGATSRLAGPLIDLANSAWAGMWLGYPLLFALAAISALAGSLVLLKIQDREQC